MTDLFPSPQAATWPNVLTAYLRSDEAKVLESLFSDYALAASQLRNVAALISQTDAEPGSWAELVHSARLTVSLHDQSLLMAELPPSRELLQLLLQHTAQQLAGLASQIALHWLQVTTTLTATADATTENGG